MVGNGGRVLLQSPHVYVHCVFVCVTYVTQIKRRLIVEASNTNNEKRSLAGRALLSTSQPKSTGLIRPSKRDDPLMMLKTWELISWCSDGRKTTIKIICHTQLIGQSIGYHLLADHWPKSIVFVSLFARHCLCASHLLYMCYWYVCVAPILMSTLAAIVICQDNTSSTDPHFKCLGGNPSPTVILKKIFVIISDTHTRARTQTVVFIFVLSPTFLISSNSYSSLNIVLCSLFLDSFFFTHPRVVSCC